MTELELRQELIEEHRKRISRGEELDFVYFELYKELQEENARLKKEAYSHKNNVFAELNDETAHSNEELMLELADLEKQNKELQEQIEKMKCCGNCIYRGNCELGGYKECKNFDKWELAV